MSILYVLETCPCCGTRNLVYLGDMSDQTAVDVEGYLCRQCRATIRMPLAEGEVARFDAEVHGELGMPPPRY